MSNNTLIDGEVDEFYAQGSEEDRLKLGLGPLEFERNKELIERYLLSPKGLIIDVGGGPGVYAEWLARKGYTVHLVDPVEKHIKQASKRAGKLKNPYTAVLGEARKLTFPDNFADLVLVHGPLYHLQQKQERLEAIREARRVLKPGGIFLGFAINYTASTLVGLLQGAIHQPEFYTMCTEELTRGIHNAPKTIPGILPKAYYHKPPELRSEIEEAGLDYLDTLAVEGMIWLDRNYFETRSNPQQKKKVMDLLKITENDKNLLSFSPHMMIAARKK